MATTRPAVLVLAARVADLGNHLMALSRGIDRRNGLIETIANVGRDEAYWSAASREAQEDLATAPKGLARETAGAKFEKAQAEVVRARAELKDAKDAFGRFEASPQAGAVVGAKLLAAERACAIEFATADAALDCELVRVRRELYKTEGEGNFLSRQAEKLARPIRPGEPGSGIRGGKIRRVRLEQARALRNQAYDASSRARDLEELAYAA